MTFASRVSVPILLAVLLLALPFPAAHADQASDLEAAKVHYFARRDGEARAAFETILARDSRADEALYYLARLAKRQRDWATVAARLEEAVKIVPNSAMYWGDLGEAYGNQARGAGALSQLSLARKTLAALKKAAALDPSNLAIRNGLVEFYREAPWIAGGGIDKAYDEAKDIAKIDPYRGAVISGGLYQHEEKWSEAERNYRNAIRLQPENSEARFALAQLMIGTGRHDEAFTMLEDILQANPRHFASLYQIGRVAALSGKRLDRGEAALREYIAASVQAMGLPSVAHAWHRLGNVLERKGDSTGAREAYQKALEIDPKLKEAADALAKLL
ncbi:MAG TPA: tetratricopeptide repeat protein [Opitutaceae bacterium]|nr:tetratricopeptide repeat protein [Opitutaceae bacterium]